MGVSELPFSNNLKYSAKLMALSSFRRVQLAGLVMPNSPERFTEEVAPFWHLELPFAEWTCKPVNPFYIACSAIPSNQNNWLTTVGQLLTPEDELWPHGFNGVGCLDILVVGMKLVNVHSKMSQTLPSDCRQYSTLGKRKLGTERIKQIQIGSVPPWVSPQDVRVDDVGCSRETDQERTS
jgi:hypothetical protein